MNYLTDRFYSAIEHYCGPAVANCIKGPVKYAVIAGATEYSFMESATPSIKGTDYYKPAIRLISALAII